MNRRQSRLTLSALAGHARFAGVAAAFTQRAAAPPASWRPELLPAALAPVLEEGVETILPETCRASPRRPCPER